MTLTPGQSTSKLEQSNGITRALPFTLRCDGTGQENYPDGTPKKWWSKLTVLEDGRETLRKEIVVNDPLVTLGIRFYQSGYGQTGEVESLLLNATGHGETKQITLRPFPLTPGQHIDGLSRTGEPGGPILGIARRQFDVLARDDAVCGKHHRGGPLPRLRIPAQAI